MSKIRINDLARELEVKSRVILDALPAVGFTEHKTHSSAVEEDVAEKVRRYLRGEPIGDGASAPAGEVAAEPESIAPVEPKKEAAAEQPALETHVEAPEAPHPQPTGEPHAPLRPSGIRPAPPSAPLPISTPKMPTPPPRPVYQAPAPPVTPTKSPVAPSKSPKAPTMIPPSAPTPTRPTQAPPMQPAAQATPPAPTPRPTPSLKVAPNAPAAPSQPPAGTRRVIVPVASQRPVYTAPPPQPKPTPGQPLVSRPAAPSPGKPIYQRPAAPGARPGAPAGARTFTPEGRRPMHPTRAVPPRPAPGPRTPHHVRREPRVKEGPLKYQPSAAPAVPQGPLPITRTITLPEGITVKELADRLGVKAKDVIRRLLDTGAMVTVNQALDAELAKQIAREFGADATMVSYEEEALKEVEQVIAEDPEKLRPRAPVVTIMGHVDHGKTSLLDAIRQTNVAGGEAGGITQHIGAYRVQITDKASPAYGRDIVFIDTPGHAAFTRMRARGARVTDIVVLVVAADDGVMPQTLEAIDHARAANVPIIVAINKIDKPDAQSDRVKRQLADHGLQPEDWGGQTVMVGVSAKAKTNLNLLLEMILLVSDLQGLKADPDRSAQGTVLEAQLDRGRGPVATVLVQNGTLRSGDTLILGNVLARVRAMFDDRGRTVDEAGPSMPVEVLGLEGLPEAGDRFLVVNDRYRAKQIATYREQKARESNLLKTSRLKLESLGQQMEAGAVKELPLIIKADVQGSAEVLVDTLTKLSTNKVKVQVIHTGVGAITESDVLLAAASNAIIIGFNVRPERKAAELAEQEKVEIRLHSIIYELTDEIKKAMTGLLEPTIKETLLGRAEVRQTFRIPKVGTIAGCYVREGKLTRDSQVRVVRDGVVIYTSRLNSLKRFKDDATEVKSGMECGAGVANFSDLKPGDILEAFVTEKIAAPAIT